MANKQHRTISDPDIHEPKGVAGAESGTVYIANGTNSGSWQSLKDFVGTGWGYYEDDTLTLGSPLSVTATSTPGTQLTINSSVTETDELPSDATSPLWNAGTNKINPIAEGDSYSVRLSLTASNTTGATYAIVYLDVGGASGIIYENPILFPAGDGTKVSLDFTLRVNADFATNGGSLHIYKDGGTLEIIDTSILITRLHKGDN